MNEIWIIRSKSSGQVVGTSPTREAALEKVRSSAAGFSRFGYTIEHFIKDARPETPQGFVGKVSMDGGTTTFEDGTYVNLLEVQAVLNSAFQEHGDQKYADAADTLSKLTGLVQGPHGEWEDA